MARIRTIKPEFFTSLTIADLPFTARLTFIGLWTEADDEGRLLYDPRLVRAAVWPLDDRSVEDVVNDVGALTERSLIVHYKVDGREYLQINGWAEHQKINRPQPSKLPPPPNEGDDATFPHDTGAGESSLNDHGTVSERSLPERKGKERKGKEYSPTSVGRKTHDYSPDFELFWKAYPKKDQKFPASIEFDKARKFATTDELVEAAKRYAKQVPDEKFRLLGKNWLAFRCWEQDENEIKSRANTERWEQDRREFGEPLPDFDLVDGPHEPKWRRAVREAYGLGMGRDAAFAYAYREVGVEPPGGAE